MRLWQKTMIRLARSQRMTGMMQNSRLMRGFAKSFVGGGDVAAGVARASELRGRGIRASLFYLGEYVDDPALVERNVRELMAVIPELNRAGLDVHVSVDPTQVGSMISWDLCRDNVLALCRAVAENKGPGLNTVMLDMEDSSVTQQTLDLFHEMNSLGLPVSVTVQAYLHRTSEDIEELIRAKAMVRLVKGAFAEPPDRAVSGRKQRDKAYRACMEQLFSSQARESGVYPVLGTHDHTMVEHGARLAEESGWARDKWEVEMLLGVRPDYQRKLAGQGYGVRVYLPYGESWWPYSIRRVGETPRNLAFVLRSLFSRGRKG